MKLAVEINAFEPKRGVGVGSAWLSSALLLDWKPTKLKDIKRRLESTNYRAIEYSCKALWKRLREYTPQKFRMELENELLDEEIPFKHHHESFSGSVLSSAGLQSLRARTRTGCSPCVEGTWGRMSFNQRKFSWETSDIRTTSQSS